MSNIIKTLVVTALLSTSTLSFAGSDGDIVAGLIEIGKNLTSKQNTSAQLAGAIVTGDIQATAVSTCGASNGSVCQNFAGGSTNQNSARGSKVLQIAVGGGQSGTFKAIQGGSATNQSTSQNAAAYSSNQNAEISGN